MKRFGLLGLLLALVLPAFSAQIDAGRALTAVPPLAELGGLVHQSLSRFSPQAVPSAVQPSLSVLPSIYDTAKAQALLDRAAELPATAIAKLDPAQAAAPKPTEIISAVNSVLKDFTPDQLKKMPAEDLQGLSDVILDQLQGRLGRRSATKSIGILAAAKADKLLAERGKTVETLLNPGHTDMHPDDILVKGTPNNARLLRPTVEPSRGVGYLKTVPIEKDTVLRHYTTADGFKQIMESKSLWNGFVPYVELARGTYKKTFRDVSGVFLTLPKVSGDHVGVPAREFTHYVDVLVPGGLTLLEIEAGAIYLVPLPGRTRDWVRDYYLKWANGGAVPGTYQRMVDEMNAEGGPGPSLRVPVKIVGHGQVR